MATMPPGNLIGGNLATPDSPSVLVQTEIAQNLLPLPVLDAPNQPILGIIGDSRAAASYGTVGSAPGTTTKFPPNSPIGWACFLSNQVIKSGPIYNKAVSGSLITDMVGQFASLLQVTPKVTHVYILSGTNSFAAGVTAATAWSDLLDLLKVIKRAGIVPIINMDLPRALASWTAANAQNSFQFNQLVRAYGPAAGALVVDPSRYIADSASASGDPLSGYYYDGIHPATSAAYYIGKELSDNIIAKLQPAPLAGFTSRGDVFNATNNPYGNALSNGLFVGTAGTNTSSGGAASGTVADSWNNRTLDGTGTSVASIVTRTDGKPGNLQQLVQTSGAGTSNYRFSTIANPAINTNYPSGYSLVLEADIIVSSATGLEGMGWTITNYDGTTVRDGVQCFGSTLISSTYFPFPGAFSGRMRSPPLPFNSLANQLLVRFETRVTNGAATIQIGGMEIRAIPTDRLI